MERYLSHGGNIYHAARALSRDASDLCDFSASINPLGVPLAAQRVLQTAMRKIQHYPDPEGWPLLRAIAKGHGISPDNVLLGNGTVELIYAIPAALNIRHGLIIGPTFSEYERVLTLAHARVTSLLARSEDQYRPPVREALERVAQPRSLSHGSGKSHRPIDAVFLCNPNSPTGQSVSRNSVYRILEEVKRHGGCLIVDETFVEFCEEKSVIRRAVCDDSLLVLRSFTKFYGIPGLRIGYAVGTEKRLQAIRNRLPPWSVNTLAQEAALACLQDHRYRKRTLLFFQKERPVFRRALERIPGFRVYPSSANFFLVELPRPLTSHKVQAALMERGFLVRDCSNYPGLHERMLRFAVRTSNENARLVKHVQHVVNAQQ